MILFRGALRQEHSDPARLGEVNRLITALTLLFTGADYYE
ncbi:MAG: hypothetical protein N838_06640 [Thiohalocapsa sp. PB-PSB1]|nr:MAG: hypothetical protein N838_06640 [Thiohalocapsa sp. PB-PSB1]